MLYMFQAVPPPIIRNSKCIYSIGYFVKALLLPATVVEELALHFSTTVEGSSTGLTKCPMLYIQFWAPDDGRRNRLKHVEHFTEINKLCNVASCWLYMNIRLRCTEPWTSNVSIIFSIPSMSGRITQARGLDPWNLPIRELATVSSYDKSISRCTQTFERCEEDEVVFSYHQLSVSLFPKWFSSITATLEED